MGECGSDCIRTSATLLGTKAPRADIQQCTAILITTTVTVLSVLNRPLWSLNLSDLRCDMQRWVNHKPSFVLSVCILTILLFKEISSYIELHACCVLVINIRQVNDSKQFFLCLTDYMVYVRCRRPHRGRRSLVRYGQKCIQYCMIRIDAPVISTWCLETSSLIEQA